jgi:hypothetical protein
MLQTISFRVDTPSRYLTLFQSGIFYKLLQSSIHSQHSGVQASADTSFLWHERLAHPGAHVITALQRRELVPAGVSNRATHIGECESCALGKGKRTPRQPREPFAPSLDPFAVLHADLCFPRGIQYDCLLTVVCEEHTLVRALYGLLYLINESLNPVGVALKA